ncbi:MAG: bifunctional demethylmenaquinone methyltransferase/2-methoxy-6-polyprenyl-1,4-benzoquinol methylase UbiE [Deltaproteobacteria bacterium]|nr:bifunctional demethylmenaquinone methyltransferase/2-methoxy-6-polyprenyl-1,4-benzoquinol methylase UbiE [Deltaproteobacteria bacterium]
MSHADIPSMGPERTPAGTKVKQVQGLFDRVAKRYDAMNTILSLGIHHVWKRTAMRLLSLGPGDWLIDVCGGTGDLALLSAKHVGNSGRVILYDMNRAMIEAGRPRIERSPSRDRIELVLGDAEKISFQDNCFDAAMVGFGIRNLGHMERGLREMYRVIKPGGKALCLEFSNPSSPLFRSVYDFYSFHVIPLLGSILAGSREAYSYLTESIRVFSSPEELAAMMRDIGFRNVLFRRLTRGIATIHLGDK